MLIVDFKCVQKLRTQLVMSMYIMGTQPVLLVSKMSDVLPGKEQYNSKVRHPTFKLHPNFVKKWAVF